MTTTKLLEVRITEPEVADRLECFNHPARYRFTLFFQRADGLTWEVGNPYEIHSLDNGDVEFETNEGFDAVIVGELENSGINYKRADRFEILGNEL